MHLKTTLVGLVAAAVCAVPAPASSTAQDPLRLVPQRSDFPAKTRWSAARSPSIDKALAAAGLQAKSADYSADVSIGSTETVHVKGRVIVLTSPAEAQRMFGQYKRDLALDLKLATVVRLPAYGDEQSAFTQGKPGARADLRVRKGAVVWRVEVIMAGTEKYRPAQALAQLRIYAAKLKRRVGSGS